MRTCSVMIKMAVMARDHGNKRRSIENLYLSVSNESWTRKCEKNTNEEEKIIICIYLHKYFSKYWYFMISCIAMESENCSISDIMNQLKVIHEQNVLILTQNSEIKDELSKFKSEIVQRVAEVEGEIGSIKSDIGFIKKSPKFQNGQFETHKQVQKNIESNYVIHEKQLLSYENRLVTLEKEVKYLLSL